MDIAVDGAVTVNGASDQTGTARLYERHVPAAVRLAYLLTGDAATAQDVAHDAFLKAAARFHLMRDPELFGAYLRRTVVRTVLMRRRSAEREQARAERAVRQSPADLGDPAAESSDHVDLVAALRTLPARQQAVLVLRFWLDLPEAEIARAVGCRPGTVKSTLARGLDALRKAVPADG
jgi:RNA polymerase sigma-70 factor (sigma-E family)